MIFTICSIELLEITKPIVCAFAEWGAPVPFQIFEFIVYSLKWCGQSFLSVMEVLRCWLISIPSHTWNPVFRFISCFQRYRASPDITTRDPGVKSTGTLTEPESVPSTLTRVKCITHEDWREIMAMASSNFIRSTWARIPWVGYKEEILLVKNWKRHYD